MKRISFLDVLIFLFVFLFVYAAASKLLDYELFEAQIGKSPLITRYAGWVAWAVPSIEVLISVLMIFPGSRLIGLFGFFFMMITFSLYILFILNFSPYVPCSCGGILNEMGWTEHLIFNTVFTVLSIVAILLCSRKEVIKDATVVNV